MQKCIQKCKNNGKALNQGWPPLMGVTRVSPWLAFWGIKDQLEMGRY